MRRCIACIAFVCLLTLAVTALAQEPFALEELHLVRWEHGHGTSWGENHDVWSEEAWLAAGRRKL